LVNTFNTVWPMIRDAAKALIDWWNENWPSIRDTIITIVDEISERWDSFSEQLRTFAEWFMEEMWPEMKEVWSAIQEHVIPIIQSVIDIVQALWDYFMVAWPAIYTVLQIWWGEMASTVEFAVSIIVETVDFMLTTIRGFLDIIAGLLTLDWARVWEGAKTVVTGFNNFIVGIIQAIWERLRGWINTVQDTMRAGWNGVKSIVEGVWNGIVSFFQSLPGRLAGAFVALAGMVAAPFIAAFNGIRSAWNNTVGGFGFSIPSWVPLGMGGKSFHIPSMALGGVATYPMLALIGDAGPQNPEIVSPVNMMKATMLDALRLFASQAPLPLVGIETSTSGPPSIVFEAGAIQINVQGDGDEERIRSVVHDTMREVLEQV
jgi:hypothetical protein